MALHKALPASEIHIPYAFSFADEATRLAATHTSEDIGKLVLQEDIQGLYLLTSTSPATAQFIGGGGGTNPVSSDGVTTVSTVPVWGNTLGTLLSETPVTIDNSGNITTAGTVDGRDVSVDGSLLDAQLPSVDEKAALVGTSGTPDANNKYVTNKTFTFDGRIIYVAQDGAEFTSVKTAVESIVDASPTKKYLVDIAPGTYTEAPFTVPAHVTVTGSGIANEVILVASNNSAHFITLEAQGLLTHLAISGPTGAGYACVDYAGTGFAPAILRRIVFLKGYYSLNIHPASYGVVIGEDLGFNYSISAGYCAVRVTDAGALKLTSPVVATNAPGSLTKGFTVEGPSAVLSVSGGTFSAPTTTDAYYINDGGTIYCIGTHIPQAITAFHVGPDGTGSNFTITATVLGNDLTNHIVADTATCAIGFIGSIDPAKCSYTDPLVFTSSAYQPGVGAIIAGELYNGHVDHLLPVTTWNHANRSTGLIEGGLVEVVSGLEVTIAAGSGFVTGVDSNQYYVEWEEDTLTLPSNEDHIHICIDKDGIFCVELVEPDQTTSLILAEAVTNNTDTVFMVSTAVSLPQLHLRMHSYAEDVIGPVSVSGCIASKYEAIPLDPSLKLSVDSGTFYIYTQLKSATANSNITWTYWYRDAGNGWITVPGVTEIDTAYYDDGSGTLAAITAGKYKRDTIYVAVNDGDTNYHVIYGQELFDTDLLALNNPIPPDIIAGHALLSAAIIVQEAATDITEIVDQRPRIGQSAAAGSPVTIHGQLSGLAANDHPQYQLVSAKNQANGYAGLNGSTKIDTSLLSLSSSPPGQISVGAGAVGVSTLLAREDHNHSISVGTPTAITPGDSVNNGVATSLARSDHQHSLPAFGTTLGTFCQGNDSRLSDDRTASGLRTATTVVNVSAATAPSAGQILVATNGTAATWQSPGAATSILKQTATATISVDTTTTSLTFVTLLSQAITTGNGFLLINAVASLSNSNTNQHCALRITVDGTPVVGVGMDTRSANIASAVPIIRRVPVTAGAHTVVLQWRTGGGTLQCRPVAVPDEESATLIIEEVSA